MDINSLNLFFDFDFGIAGLQNMLAGFFFVFVGIFAFWAVPGKLFKLLVAGGLMVFGFLLIFEKVTIW